MNYEVGILFASGTQGKVYALKNDPTKLIKIVKKKIERMKDMKNELQVAAAAGDIFPSISPKVYMTLITNTETDCESFMVMDKIVGQPLKKMAQYNKYKDVILTKLLTLRRHGIIVEDKAGYNMIIGKIAGQEEDKEDLYIIDYGDSKEVSLNFDEDAFIKETVKFIEEELIIGLDDYVRMVPLKSPFPPKTHVSYSKEEINQQKMKAKRWAMKQKLLRKTQRQASNVRHLSWSHRRTQKNKTGKKSV